MRIVSDLLNKIHAEVKDRNQVPGAFGFAFEILEVSQFEDLVRVKYSSKIPFGEKGELAEYAFEGELFVSFRPDEQELKQKILETWEKEKKLEDQFLLFIVRAIQWGSTQYSAIIAYLMKYKPPYIVPQIELTKKSTE